MLADVSANLLSAPADGVGPALLLSINDDKHRTLGQYLFNAPEGISRLMLEHRCRPNLHFKALFLSGGSAAEAGGLGGLVLRLKQDGHGAMQLIGPTGTSSSLSGIRPFISWQHPQIHITEPQQQQQQHQHQHQQQQQRRRRRRIPGQPVQAQCTATAKVPAMQSDRSNSSSSSSPAVAVSYADRHLQVIGFATQSANSSSSSSDSWQPPAWLLPTAVVAAASDAAAGTTDAPTHASREKSSSSSSDSDSDSSSSESCNSDSLTSSSSSRSNSFKSAGVTSSAADDEPQQGVGNAVVCSSGADQQSKPERNSGSETHSSSSSQRQSSSSSSEEASSSSADTDSSSSSSSTDSISNSCSSTSSSSIEDESDCKTVTPKFAVAAGTTHKQQQLFDTLDSIFIAAAAPRLAGVASGRGPLPALSRLTAAGTAAAAAAAATDARVRASALAALSGKSADDAPATAAAAADNNSMDPKPTAAAAGCVAAIAGQACRKRKQQAPQAAARQSNKKGKQQQQQQQQQRCNGIQGSIRAGQQQQVVADVPDSNGCCCLHQPHQAAAAAALAWPAAGTTIVQQQQKKKKGDCPQQLLGYVCHILPISNKHSPTNPVVAAAAAAAAKACETATTVDDVTVGQLVAVLFCRNEQQLLQLQQHPAVAALCSCGSSSCTDNSRDTNSSSSRVLAVFHITSAAVAVQPDYQAWMQQLPGQQVLMPHQQTLASECVQQQQQGHNAADSATPTAAAVAARPAVASSSTRADADKSNTSSCCHMNLGFRASARVLSRLNLVSPVMFPLPYPLKQQQGLSEDEVAAVIQQAAQKPLEKAQQQQQEEQGCGAVDKAAAAAQHALQQQLEGLESNVQQQPQQQQLPEQAKNEPQEPQQQQQQQLPKVMQGQLLQQLLWRGLQYCPPLKPLNHQPQWDWAEWQWKQWEKQQQQQPEVLTVRDLQAELLQQRPKLQQLLPIARKNWPNLTRQQQQQPGHAVGEGRPGSSSSSANKAAAQALREKLAQLQPKRIRQQPSAGQDVLGAESPAAAAAAAPAAPVAAANADVICAHCDNDADDESAPAVLTQPWAADTSVIFLGTGSAEPSKYRGPSAILLRVKPGRSGSSSSSAGAGSAAAAAAWLLMDAGEGTLGAIQRHMGPEAAAAAVDSLACIWISHKHADHMLGIPALLEAKAQRRRCTAHNAVGTCDSAHDGGTTAKGGTVAGSTKSLHEPVLLVGPREMLSWLQQLPGHASWQYTFVPLADFKGELQQQQQQQIVAPGIAPPRPPPMPPNQQQQQPQEQSEAHQLTIHSGWEQQQQQQQQQQSLVHQQQSILQQQQFMIMQQQQMLMHQQQQMAYLQQAHSRQMYNNPAHAMRNSNMMSQQQWGLGFGPMQMGPMNPSMMPMMQNPGLAMQQQQWSAGFAMHAQMQNSNNMHIHPRHNMGAQVQCYSNMGDLQSIPQQQQQQHANERPTHSKPNMPAGVGPANAQPLAAVQHNPQQQQQQQLRGSAAVRVMAEVLGFTAWESVPVAHCAGAHGLVLTHRQGWKLVYSGDTRPCAALAAAGAGATLLIHEATFECGLAHHARAKGHSTLEEALQAAHHMQAYRTVLTHFSQRYPRLPAGYPHDARPWRQRPLLAVDGAVVTFSLLPQLPALMPAVAAALEELEEQDQK